MSHRSVSAMHRFWLIAITVSLLTACANQATPLPTAMPPSASGVAVTQTAPADQASQPRPATATSTPEPTPTSTSAPTATALPPSPKPTATFTPAPTKPSVVTATPPEVAHGVEFAIERKTVEAPDGSNLEVVGWSTGRLGIYFEKAFADGAYTFGLDGSKKEAGAILMPDPKVSWEEIQGRFENLVIVVVGAKLGLVDTSKPIPRAKLEEIKEYLAEHPDASYEVRSGGGVIGSVKANAPIRVVIVKPKLNAERTMKAGFEDDEAKVMAPFTKKLLSWALDAGRMQHLIDEDGNLMIVFEPLYANDSGNLQTTRDYWLFSYFVTLFGYEAAGAFDSPFRGQGTDLSGFQAFRYNSGNLDETYWSDREAYFRKVGKPSTEPVLSWRKP